MPEGGHASGIAPECQAKVLHVTNTGLAPRFTHALPQAEQQVWACLLAGAKLPEPPVLGQNIQGCLLPVCH